MNKVQSDLKATSIWSIYVHTYAGGRNMWRENGMSQNQTNNVTNYRKKYHMPCEMRFKFYSLLHGQHFDISFMDKIGIFLG